MKTFVTIIVILASMAAVRLGAGYVYSAVQSKNTVDEVSRRASRPNGEPIISEAEFRTEFMKGCNTGELDGDGFDQTAYCECLYTKFRKDYSINQAAKAGLNNSEAQIEAIMTPYGNACLSEMGFEV